MILNQLFESNPSGSDNYAENLAQKVFNVRPNLRSDDDVLNIGHKVATQDLMSQVRANYLFARDQDFPSDFVSAYYSLQKRKPGVAEGSLNEFAPGDGGDSGEEDTLRKFARMWYNGDDATQQRVEQALARQGWEIGELESEEGGAFVVQSGDEHGDSYIGFTADDLTEGVTEGSQRVDSLVTDALKIMQGSEISDAVTALKTVLGDREYNGRRGFYNFYIRQLIDMYSKQGVAEAGPYGSRNPDTMNSNEYDRYQQDQMDQGKRDFKRREHEAEWEQEQAYSAKLAARDAGTWYIRLNGKLIKDKTGKPYSFRGKAAANKAALTMQAKLFNQGKEFMLTTNPNDPQQGMAKDAVEEGIGSKLAGLGLAGAMALGSAGANARVTPDGQGGFTGGLKPSATVTAPADNKPAAEAPKGFSKEYLQKAADPNRFGRYMISVEKAQELLKNMQEGVTESQIPTNTNLWKRAKIVAEGKFNTTNKHSLLFATKWYQQHGGTWKS
jgi:hypothetical protein